MRVEQTKKAKEEFYSPILEYLKKPRTKEDIANYMCVSIRRARNEVSLVGKYHAVIRGSFIEGYRRAKGTNEMNEEELHEEYELVSRTTNEFNSRVEDMKQTLHTLIKHKKALEKHINKNKKNSL